MFSRQSHWEKYRESAYSYYFGEIIGNRRKELKMSQEKLAEVVGKKRPYISRIENGEDVRLSNLLLVANALDLTIQLTTRIKARKPNLEGCCS